MQTYRDFVADVLGPITQLPMLEMPITGALGCAAAQSIAADRAVPGFRQAAVDGVAVVAADAASAHSATPVILPIGETVKAGAPAEALAVGHCARVATGAPLPETADAVVPVGECTIEDDKVVLTRPPVAGEGFLEVGSQFKAGDVVLTEGQYLGHIGIAELALIGVARVQVHPRPRVVVLTIGSELVPVGDPAGEVTVHDAAGVLLTTTAKRLGADCYRVGPVPDDPRAVRDAVEDQLVRADVVVTCGGIDEPDDVLRKELVGAGLARFDGPPLHPCPAYGVGRVGPDSTPIIALPSDPAAALLAFHALARPVITAMIGRDVNTRAESIAAPRTPAAGTMLVPGSFDGQRFVPVATAPLTLRTLAPVTAIAICNADAGAAEVVEWPY